MARLARDDSMKALTSTLVVVLIAASLGLASFAVMSRAGSPGTGLRTPLADANPTPGPNPGPPAPADANDTLLASVGFSAGFGTVTPVDAVENRFVMSNDSGTLPAWDIGDGVAHTNTDPTNFTAASDPDFPTVAALLTNGVDNWIDLDTNPPGSGGVGSGTWEHGWLDLNPDLVNHTVDTIRLVIYDLTFTPMGNGTFVSENYTWEIWGHADVASLQVSGAAAGSPFIAAAGRIAADDRLALR